MDAIVAAGAPPRFQIAPVLQGEGNSPDERIAFLANSSNLFAGSRQRPTAWHKASNAVIDAPAGAQRQLGSMMPSVTGQT